MKNTILILILLAFNSLVFSQTTQKFSSPYSLFYSAEDLFKKEQYASARIEFRNFINSINNQNDPYYIKALYYEGVSAIELFNNDAVKLLEDFNKNYPESNFKKDIYFRLGKYYYQKKDFKTTLKWFNQLSKYDIEKSNIEEFQFKLAYSNFQEKKIKEARDGFYEVKDGTSIFAPPALYYFSHIAYEEKSYKVALEGFEKLVLNENFKQISQNYIIQINYRLGKYEEVISKGPIYLKDASGTTLLEMNHLIGDAFFALGKFDESVPFLEEYNNNVKTKRQDDYQLAYAYYKSTFYEKAVNLFDKIVRTKDSLAQISYYHIAECYLKLKNNVNARTAFEQASVLTFSPKIQEDALYNYAILSYKLDINPYDEAIEALELYLLKYPNSDRKKEVYEYLLNVYTSTKNYGLALKSLDKISDKNHRLKAAYQMIAYNQGVDLFQKSNFEGAINAFALVSKYNINDQTTADALYWTAESQYYLKKYDKAITLFKQYISTPGTAVDSKRKDALYNIGYAYLTKAKFNDAIEYFRLYLQETNNNDKTQKADVYLRLADCYYTTKQNDLAIKNYQECLNLDFKNQDQALYYLSKTYGYKNEMDLKIKHLLDLINNFPKSKYIILSIHEVALSYRFKNDDSKALKYFEQLLKDHPNSPLVKDAQIEIADIYYKNKDYQKAEEAFLKILNDNEGNRTTCAKAIKGIVEIYKAQRVPEKVEPLLVKYPCADFTIDDQEELYYNSAIEPYMDSSYQESVTELEKYLKKFPKGKYLIEIKSYLANCHYQLKQEEKAIAIYEELIEKPLTDFTEIAAIRVSKYYYNNSKYKEALPNYKKLEKISSKPDVIFNAKLGVMRCQFLLEAWNEALEYSNKILTYTQLNQTIKLEAEFAKAISQYRLEKYEDAKKSLEWIVKNTTSIFAAEAKYTIAELAFKQNDLPKAEEEIKSLLKMKPSYDYWIAKALILQTKILMTKKDYFQAEYTIKSVVDNYTNQNDGILLQANQIWDEVMQLKNKTKQVNEPPTTIIEIKNDGKK
jgi:tetratricopeptide (TPR) repeat protein